MKTNSTHADHGRTVSFLGTDFPLAGTAPAVGSVAPNFCVTQWTNLYKVHFQLENLLQVGKPVLLTTSQTVDSPVSTIQILTLERMLRKFNRKVCAMHVTCDLPFSINRFFREHNIQHIFAGSDYREHSFLEFGVMLRDELILCRSCFIIDDMGVIQHVEIPSEITTELDYLTIEKVLDGLLQHDEDGSDEAEDGNAADDGQATDVADDSGVA